MAIESKQPIIIKKVVKGGGHGHHGGAWKIAYADFVTAMMAFFMLLWLLANTTEEQKQGIADYFSPSTPSQQNSGSDGVMGGQSLDSEGAQNQGSVMLSMTQPQQASAPQEQSEQDSVQSMIAEREEDRFRMAQEDLQTEIQQDPELQDFQEHIIVDLTPEGMRIQIVDSNDRSMFKSGTAELLPHAQRILKEVAKIIVNLPNRLRVSGHTDATAFNGANGYGNWELSSDRANAARRVLMESKIPPERLYEVTGKAGTEPLFPEDPSGPANRRISIVLMREAPVLPPGYIR